MVRKLLLLTICSMIFASCMGPTITGPNNLYQPPAYGWTKQEVIAHWGIPYSSSYYGNADTWIYRRSYFVSGPYGSTIQAEYAAVAFVDGKVVGVSY